jgi:hypothetical protein
MKKILENLEEAKREIKTLDHMLYMTFPIVRENKFLLNILSKNTKVLKKIINSILQYEYIYKRIQLYNNPEKNLQTFKNKISKRYEISEEEIAQIQELLEISDAHEKSSMEFKRENEIIILSENMEKRVINVEKIKKQINLLKTLLTKIEKKLI